MMLLDSNIVIYAAEPNYAAAREFIAKHNPSVSVISKVEVLGYHQLSDQNRRKLESIFQFLPILPLSDHIIERAISLRQTKKMSLGDALIAGTAIVHEMDIVTANVKDFKWIDDLEIINPLQDQALG
jgi:predicted nucleic acid-binding protein